MRLVFNAVNKDIFEMLRDGSKRVETRAATIKYKKLCTGESITFVCQGETFEKTVLRVNYFPSIGSLLEQYKPEDINPKLYTKEEIIKMYHSFPGYKEKIEQFGIVAIEFT